MIFKSRNGNDREIRENKFPRKKWKVQSRKLILANLCVCKYLYTRSFLPLKYMIVVYHDIQHEKIICPVKVEKWIWRQKWLGDWSKMEPKNNFEHWNHKYQLEIIVVYHNMQNKQVKFELKSKVLKFHF